MNSRRRTSCPVCQATESRLHRVVPRGDTRFEIVRCASCGFVYVADLQVETYRAVQQVPSVVPEKIRHRQVKRLCDRHFAQRDAAGAKRRVLEVGAGWGALARLFTSDPAYAYTGFEPSASRAAYARERGYDVRQELFRGPQSAGPADAIVIDNVLEHVEEPRLLLRASVDTLKEGGVLVVIVPNVDDVRQLHAGWRARHHWQPHCHINYFSAEDLRRLFQANGMTLRFFGFGTVEPLRDWAVLPRVLADSVGVHLLGLNCYAVKTGSTDGPGSG